MLHHVSFNQILLLVFPSSLELSRSTAPHDSPPPHSQIELSLSMIRGNRTNFQSLIHASANFNSLVSLYGWKSNIMQNNSTFLLLLWMLQHTHWMSCNLVVNVKYSLFREYTDKQTDRRITDTHTNILCKQIFLFGKFSRYLMKHFVKWNEIKWNMYIGPIR